MGSKSIFVKNVCSSDYQLPHVLIYLLSLLGVWDKHSTQRTYSRQNLNSMLELKIRTQLWIFISNSVIPNFDEILPLYWFWHNKILFEKFTPNIPVKDSAIQQSNHNQINMKPHIERKISAKLWKDQGGSSCVLVSAIKYWHMLPYVALLIETIYLFKLLNVFSQITKCICVVVSATRFSMCCLMLPPWLKPYLSLN